MLVFLARSMQARAPEDLQCRNADIQHVVEERTRELATAKERALVTLESIADGVVTRTRRASSTTSTRWPSG